MDARIRQPQSEELPEALLTAAREVCQRLASAGHRGWLVGGAVRDLAMGRTAHDADLTTAATPDEIECCFARTVAVGKAFGTIVVQSAGLNIEVTTFRAEGSYSDGRRPDSVSFGKTLEQDAERRDFTCNAMYLDPLTDEFRDPTRGLDDLRSGYLRCVGDPLERFREDGLRLMRLARFAASLGLAVEEQTLAGACANAARIDSVSGERILNEWKRIAGGPDPEHAARVLVDTGVLGVLLPGAPALDPGRFEALGPEPGIELLLAVLLGGDAGGVERLAAWHPSRAITRGVEAAWTLERDLAQALDRGEDLRRSERIRIVRDAAFGNAVGLLRARNSATAADPRLEAFVALARDLGADDLRPAPFLSAEDFRAAGVVPGPAWGEWLRAAEDLQLDGVHTDRASALEWLRLRMAETPDAADS